MKYLIIIAALLLIIYIIRYIRGRIDTKKWERIWKEREEKEREMRNRFVSFFYPDKSPFDFETDCYVYLENSYDERINRIIEKYYDEICNLFQGCGFRFLYIPRWQPDRSLLPLAALKEDGRKRVEEMLDQSRTVDYTKLLCKALLINLEEVKNGIFHFACELDEKDEIVSKYNREEAVKTKFSIYPLEAITEENALEFFKEYCDFIVKGRNNGGCFFSMERKSRLTYEEDCERFYGKSENELADYRFPKDMKDMAEDVKQKIEKLKDAGYYELLLHTLGNELVDDLKKAAPMPALSHLQITDDFKILLTDYDKEIRMTPLQKTIYIFYLRHPEGVEFKYLSLYYDELLAIYKVLSNRENDEKQRESIRRLVDSLDNAINEKCSRIKEAFLKTVDDYIARNYYITLREYSKEEKDRKNYYYCERLKRIVLPRHLVSYPQEIEQIAITQQKEEEERLRVQFNRENDAFSELRRKFRDKASSKQELIEAFTEFTAEGTKFRYAAYFYRAILYTHVGRYEDALADNQLLIDHNVKVWAEALVNKAEALYFLKRYEEALEEMNKYEQQVGGMIEEAEFYLIRSKINDALGKSEEAEADRQKCERRQRVKKEEKNKK